MESQFTNQENSGQEYAYSYYSAPDLTVEDIPHPENRKYGLGRAIAATVVSGVALYMSLIAFYFILFSIISITADVDSGAGAFLFAGFFLTLVSIAVAIVSLVLGIKSIKAFKKVQPRPIATLILGINAVSCAAGAFVMVIMNFIYTFIALLVFSTI